MRSPTITLAPIGTDRPAIGVPGIEQIRGVLIDNPSGSWLLLRPTNDYIPPYTLGFARSFLGGVTHVDILYRSPSGQVSTTDGDAPTIILDSEPVSDTPGASFITGFTQAQAISFSTLVRVSVGGFFALSGQVGRRYRLLTVSIALGSAGGSPPSNYDTPILYTMSSTSLIVFLAGRVSPTSPVTFHEFANGLDIPVGEGVRFDYEPGLIDTRVRASFSYHII